MLKRFICIISVLSFCVSTSYASINIFAENSTLYKIEKDYLAGNISLDDKVILQVNSIKQPAKGPLQYSSTSNIKSELELHGATLALVEMRRVWEELSQDTKQYVTLALSRISTQFTYISSNGYFKLHYDTIGTHAVSAIDLDNNLIPDFIEKCASYCDSTFMKHVEFGYMDPPTDGIAGGDTLYDVYFENIVYYGYAVPEGQGSYPWNDYYSHLVLNNDFIGFPPNTDPEGQIAGAAKATIAHEYQHAVQFGYDATEATWAMESDATYLEEIVFDQVNDNYNYLDDFLGFPHTSLMDNSGLHKYGAFVWPLYLAENFDTLLNVSAWEAARYDNIFTAYSDTLLDKYGWSMDSAYIDFTYWLFNTSSKNDGLHFNEGSDYFPISIAASHINYPVNITNSPVSVGGYGAGYITFYPGSEIGKLKLRFNGSDTRNWTAYVIKSTTQNSHEIEYITLDSSIKDGNILIENFDSYYSVTLVGVNTDEFSSSVLFTYSASIVLPYYVSSVIQAPSDSLVYSGGVRTFEVLVRNESTIHDIYNVISWDNQGWLPMDTFAFAINPGDSSVAYVDVTPPDGTPLGEFSQLSFKTVSWGDSTVFDLQTKTAETYLYRGDIDFSGEIDISDLVALVDFTFTYGPPPLPIELSADFDCSGLYDITDLVYIVEFMFNSGPNAPCNPY